MENIVAMVIRRGQGEFIVLSVGSPVEVYNTVSCLPSSLTVKSIEWLSEFEDVDEKIIVVSYSEEEAVSIKSKISLLNSEYDLMCSGDNNIITTNDFLNKVSKPVGKDNEKKKEKIGDVIEVSKRE